MIDKNSYLKLIDFGDAKIVDNYEDNCTDYDWVAINGPCMSMDCEGTCGGFIEFDECGICGGDNTTCIDCMGMPNGTSFIDFCGEFSVLI